MIKREKRNLVKVTLVRLRFVVVENGYHLINFG